MIPTLALSGQDNRWLIETSRRFLQTKLPHSVLQANDQSASESTNLPIPDPSLGHGQPHDSLRRGHDEEPRDAA